jgi:hypothetical protein
MYTIGKSQTPYRAGTIFSLAYPLTFLFLTGFDLPHDTPARTTLFTKTL